MADVTAAAGVAYGVVGGSHAAVYAIAGESLIRDYAAAPSAATATAFGLVTRRRDRRLADRRCGDRWRVAPRCRLGGHVVGALVRALHRCFGAILILFGVLRMFGVSFDTEAPATPAFALIGILGLWTAAYLWRDPNKIR